ncbi:MAG TPA: NFACT family protein [Candidatus Faecousia intestinigallinarum]|nr:NFACT family protein [Candidatus Faecousia intestinigallinarum]
MAFDAFFLSFVLEEIRESCLGGRVEKIHQPSRDAVILHLRCTNGREKLLFSPNPAAPRLHLTAASPENPAEPPMFCMLLRKHLLGARLSEIAQPPMERCAQFTFDCTDEMGYPTRKRLVAELMGRTCNLYLLDADGRIIDCLRRIGLGESSRPALPGLYYQAPESMKKENPAHLGGQDYVRLLAQPGADVLAQRLMDNLGGLSPLICREAALYACGDVDGRITGRDLEATGEKLAEFFQSALRSPAPWYCPGAGNIPKQFAFVPLREYGEYRRADGFSQLLDSFYTLRDRRDAMAQKSQAVRKTVQNGIARLRRKMAAQEKELEATYDRERLRQLGDIVTANLHAIRKGDAKLLAEDFYDEDMKTIEIPLSPILSPQQNAAKFYKDYTRMKNAQRELTHQLELAETELNYLQSVLEELSRAETEQEMEEIREELQQGGYLRMDNVRKKPRQKKLPPLAFTSTQGYPIYVGRNNQQNEELTHRLARKNDLWLHAQKVHGSHVIVVCGNTTPPDDTITQAAQLAAYYSQARQGQNVPVDVTAAGQVKKMGGGKPGMVIYHTYRTVYVDPKSEIG